MSRKNKLQLQGIFQLPESYGHVTIACLKTDNYNSIFRGDYYE